MQNTRQTVVSLEVSTTTAPVELSFDQLRHVAGGLGPHDNWAVAAEGPHDNWATVAGPHDNW